MTKTTKGAAPSLTPKPPSRPGTVAVNQKSVRSKISADLKYRFMRGVKHIVESGQTSSLVLSGNIGDLFFYGDANSGRGAYVPLVEYLKQKYAPVQGLILIVVEVYGAVRFQRDSDREKLREAWIKQRTGLDPAHSSSWKKDAPKLAKEAGEKFDKTLLHAIGKPTVMIEFLKELCMCSRHVQDDVTSLNEKLVIIIEGADTIFPEGEMSRLHDADRRRVARCRDWFADPDFMNGHDTVILMSESKGSINDQLARMPQLLEVSIPSPDEGKRMHCIEWFTSGSWRPDEESDGDTIIFPDGAAGLAKWTAGLSIHALLQLLKGAIFNDGKLSQKDVISKVEKFISSELGGDDVVEFKKPTHRLDDLVGNTKLKKFLRSTLIPRFKMTGKGSLSGAKVCGPIGGGKTYIFEAVAAELDIPVLVLKNLRSKWYGGTDVIFERLRRVLDALAKVLIFVDEADTQFGNISTEGHQTEKRLTGKLLAMMADPQLKGRVLWLLMTARIHLLPPDMLRAGRAGDLVIPVLDAEGDDKKAFLEWVVADCVASTEGEDFEKLVKKLESTTPDYYAGCYASLRDELHAEQEWKKTLLSHDEIIAIAEDVLFPDIKDDRDFQMYQALINCTRRSLLPNPKVSDKERKKWRERCEELRAKGVV